MKNYKFYLIGIACFSHLQSCSDVFEEDISDAVITAEAPKNKAKIEGNTVQFRWNGIEGALDYRLQVNNTENDAIILDSLIANTQFNYTITPGTYAWRVRGESFAYQTPFSFERSFELIESEDLADQTLLLNKPADKEIFNKKPEQFSWEKINTAMTYEFQLFSVTDNKEENIFEKDSIIETIITPEASLALKDGNYKWQVRARNDNGPGTYFSRTFLLDTREPPVATLNKPTKGQQFTIDQEVTFEWDFEEEDPKGVNTDITGTFEIAEDDDFKNIVVEDGDLDEENFTFTFKKAGTYYWRIKGIDQAKNEGENSEVFELIVN